MNDRMTTRARHTSPAYQRRDRGGRGRCGRSVGRADQDSSWRNAQRRSIRSEISGDVERRDRDRASLSSGNRSREDHISQGRSHEIRDGMKSTNTTAPASTPIRAAPPPPPQVLWSELVAKTQLETQRAPESTAKDQTESGQPPAFENSRGVLRIPPSSIPGDGTRKGADEWTTVPKNVIVGKKNSTGKTKKRFPQPSTPSPAKSNRPRPEPIMLDLGELLSNPTPSPPKSVLRVPCSTNRVLILILCCYVVCSCPWWPIFLAKGGDFFCKTFHSKAFGIGQKTYIRAFPSCMHPIDMIEQFLKVFCYRSLHY